MDQPGPAPKTATRYVLLLLLCTAGWLAAFISLPHDRYLRYQETKKDFSKAKWIYERIHFDREPVDIAFFGTSRTIAGVDDGKLEMLLKSGSIDWRATNLAIRSHGRNMAYVVVKELLRERKPKLIVLELMEMENRLGHPIFSYLADTSDVLAPQSVLNDKLLEDWGRLPDRQLSLFLKSAFPDRLHLQRSFSPARYAGSHSWEPEDLVRTAEELQELRKRFLSRTHPQYLGDRWADLEFRFGYRYVSAICDLADAAGVPVAFLYLPLYQGAPEPLNAEFYRKRGALWIPPREMLDDWRNWSDESHFNPRGAGLLTGWLSEQVAKDGRRR